MSGLRRTCAWARATAQRARVSRTRTRGVPFAPRASRRRYYFACVAPSLVFFCTPFAFFWNGVHLLLSPGASHSGWEDHFQADQFHYL